MERYPWLQVLGARLMALAKVGNLVEAKYR